MQLLRLKSLRYSDLKKRVAPVHSKWDLTAFSGVESDLWEVEAPTGEDDLAMEVKGTRATANEGASETNATGDADEETMVVIVDDPLGQ